MSKKILLIQPRHGIWDGIFLRFPESVLSVAATPHSKGYDVTILDLRALKDWKNDLKKYLQDGSPICVGITALTGPSLKDLIDSVEIIKNFNKTIPIIFGGVHATLLPEQSLEHDGIDVVMKGEGDFTFFEAIKVFEKHNLEEVLKKNLLKNVKGVYYYNKTNEGNKLVFTGLAPMVMNLDELPDTPYELLDLSKYNAADLGNGVSASFQTSRGCPFACTFCGNEVLQKRKMRTLSVPKVVAKIKMLQNKYGYNSFVFVDDLTIAGRKHFLEFTSALKEIRPKISWTSVGIRANLISKLNDDDMKLLWDSGCRALDIGIESGSERLLKWMNKADTKENMLRANRIMSKLPIITKYSFIVGFPTETDQEREETLNFYLQLQKDNPNMWPHFSVYLPIIGTKMYDHVKKYFKQPETLKDWINIAYHEGWFFKNKNWIENYKRRELSLIMISSVFSNKNAKVKFTSFLGRLSFILYHPIAKLRFKYRFFKFPFESYTVSIVQKIFPSGITL
tara:strand:- start:52 stop:1575 length:1524 start_codon:yes stop_codon:yes gene_type:complete